MSEQTTLLERNTAGLHVEVKWLPITDIVVLAVGTSGGEQAAVTVPHAEALEAFAHPTVYLNDAQVAALFPRR